VPPKLTSRAFTSKSLDFGPYIRFDKSPIWQIHNDYFQSRGLLAWSKGEVPFTGISNYYEAYKKARFLIDNLKQLKLSSSEYSDDINILEVGAGYGEFAKNFLFAFKEISEQENLDFFGRLKYFVTDYSRVNIEELKKSKRLDFFQDHLVFEVLDVLDPRISLSRKASTSEILGGVSFDAIFANYLLDQLPARIFAYDGNNFFEKYLSLQDYKNISQKKSWIKKLKKKFRFQEIDWQEELSLEHRDILFSCFKTNKPSTIVYSYGALRAVKNFLYLLKHSGIIICSDFNASAKPGLDSFEPCYYGNSLAQAVNYEFIFKYFLDYSSSKNKIEHKVIGQKFGHQMVLIYEDPIKPLHTFFLTRPDFPQDLNLGDTYKNIYQQNWFLRAFYRFIVEIKLGFYILIVFIFAFALWHYFWR
jgi:hypothetical protein